jgi:hypothetical protein
MDGVPAQDGGGNILQTNSAKIRSWIPKGRTSMIFLFGIIDPIVKANLIYIPACIAISSLLTGCMIMPQTYDPRLVAGGRLPITGFLPDGYHEPDLGSVHPPYITVQIDGYAGELGVDICSRSRDYRHVTVLADQSSVTDSNGRRYGLAAFKSNDYANQDIGASRWIQYSTYAFGPLPSTRRHLSYGSPHTIRVVYVEDGRRYVAERQFAATYPLITPFHLIHFTN